MTEQRVTLETAKLAKEKGFDIPSGKLYRETTSEHYLINPEYAYDFDIPAPTQSLLQKWLREVYNISVEVYICNGIWISEVININNEQLLFDNSHKDFNTFELALESGLQEALKLIPEKK